MALQWSPWPDLQHGRRAGRNPAGVVAGGGGTGVGEQEEVASYLREASVGAEMAGGGSPARNRGAAAVLGGGGALVMGSGCGRA